MPFIFSLAVNLLLELDISYSYSQQDAVNIMQNKSSNVFFYNRPLDVKY